MEQPRRGEQQQTHRGACFVRLFKRREAEEAFAFGDEAIVEATSFLKKKFTQTQLQTQNPNQLKISSPHRSELHGILKFEDALLLIRYTCNSLLKIKVRVMFYVH